MTRLTLLSSAALATKPNTAVGHRASVSEGEAVRRLLEAQGYPSKRIANDQVETRCPFHEGPGAIELRKSTNFYVHKDSGLYNCHAASCGERGNLQALERYFGIGVDDDVVSAFQSKDEKLREFEANLIPELRTPFYEHGLTDTTIERFRLGYECEHGEVDEEGNLHRVPGRYVIPYLEGRRPRTFRYYSPHGDPRWKYTWETGAAAHLFNAQDSLGDENGVVYIAEGEQKAMLLCQLGYAAVAVPGASQWKDEFSAALTKAKSIIVLYDNDNPAFHNYDRPEKGVSCRKCEGRGLDRCAGHNPGQDAAVERVEQLGWRAKNVVLPLPDEGTRKVDVNDYFTRDGHCHADFAELVTGKRTTKFHVQSFDEISLTPPEAPTMLIAHGILPAGGRLLVAGKPKVGKAQPLSTPILTPSGWTTMGQLSLGERVVSPDGRPTRILQIHPQGVRPIYRVTFSDGASTRAGLKHLWTIQSRNDREDTKKDGRRRWRTVSTEDVMMLLAAGKKRDTYIPMCAPVQFDPVGQLPVEPYALGLLLGEADSSMAKDLPGEYLRSPMGQRLALLQGLMDAAGWVERNSLGHTSSYFASASTSLIDAVVEITQSLGGIAVAQRKARGVADRRVRVRLPEPFEPFRVAKKLAAWTTGRTSNDTEPVRRIVSVQFERDEEAQCITVDRQDGLYLTESYLVTHNSLFVNHLALSLAAGVPFLKQGGNPGFAVDHPTRVLLLDRELSKSSLFSRLNALIASRPGYRPAGENLLIDHDHLLRLDQKNAYELLTSLVTENGVQVVILDTAYKFFGADVESSSAVMKAFEVLDKVLHETGCSFVLTHHHRKSPAGHGSKPGVDLADPDAVAGSFLWTGWPNSTILLNYLNRSVSDPFNSVASFTAFRDDSPPDPLALYRSPDSISYTAIEPHRSVETAPPPSPVVLTRPTTEGVARLMLERSPTTEGDLLALAAAQFGVSEATIKPYYYDALSSGNFIKTGSRPPIIRYRYDRPVESWEHEHGLPERPPIDTAPLFEDLIQEGLQ